MKKLLVVSIFADDSEFQQSWLRLQLDFLRATTEDFDYVAMVSEGLHSDAFPKLATTIVPVGGDKLKSSLAHVNSLNEVLAHCRSKANEYENFLIMDGDAFPIRQNWLATLIKKMSPTDKFDSSGMALTSVASKKQNYEIAIALRPENLETRLHGSIFFVRGDAINKCGQFVFGTVGNDLAGNKEEDVHLPHYQTHFRHLAFPLLRTNKVQVHPLACGIYFDMFYHHACGSGRSMVMRATDWYLKDLVQPLQSTNRYAEQLMADPTGFISKLAGWNPQRYAKV